ncbi:Fmu (Sun) domain-containing protein [Sediminibacterium ginsengisoli]|nr:Fmu (Sun) domain-containing protein [Sediminibacterium ginsengisoli]
MKYAENYIRSAIAIMEQYNGSLPLAAFLKNYFAQHKKFGSKDRKRIAHLCYCYCRIGHAADALDTAERLRIALFLCQDEAGEWTSVFPEAWLDQWNDDVTVRTRFITETYPSFEAGKIFLWTSALSAGIDPSAFLQSHLQQPDLFIRCRPGHEAAVTRKLTEASVPFTQQEQGAIALPNATKLEDIIVLDKEAVIQDLSSQRVAQVLAAGTPKIPANVWDCCAASGGKSLLVKDQLNNINLTVSDVRQSILRNLAQRFERAGLKGYRSFVADLTMADSVPVQSEFSLIICDAPCSGSGTWGRTPEQLLYFTEDRIAHYAALQQKIVANAVRSLAPGGLFLYITCSVFSAENEDMARFIETTCKLEPVKVSLLKGYNEKADTMFAALFRRA